MEAEVEKAAVWEIAVAVTVELLYLAALTEIPMRGKSRVLVIL
jgi:hypothetical protein